MSAIKKWDPSRVEWMLLLGYDHDMTEIEPGDTIPFIPMSVIDSLAQSWYESGVSDVGPGWDDISERFRNALRDQAHKFIHNFANCRNVQRETVKS